MQMLAVLTLAVAAPVTTALPPQPIPLSERPTGPTATPQTVPVPEALPVTPMQTPDLAPIPATPLVRPPAAVVPAALPGPAAAPLPALDLSSWLWAAEQSLVGKLWPPPSEVLGVPLLVFAILCALGCSVLCTVWVLLIKPRLPRSYTTIEERAAYEAICSQLWATCFGLRTPPPPPQL